MSLPVLPEEGEVVVEGLARQDLRLVRSSDPSQPASGALVDLGVQIALTVRMVARRQAWTLTRVAVRLRCVTEPDEETQLDLDLILEGLLEDWQRRYLQGIAQSHLQQEIDPAAGECPR